MDETSIEPLNFQAVAAKLQSGVTLAELLSRVMKRIETYDDPAVWIHVLSAAQIASQIEKIEAARRAGAVLPLYGLPFAVKDNIDVAGVPTTAACPAYAYTPARSATVVERLCAAGAIVVGKANLDQFATGLVGTRSPYGTPRNPFNADYIPGGSSSGSAVAVSAGLVSFALGTDTAGSGRVPAAFNNIVGLKPTRGIIPATGVVPACRSLDCVSVFALTSDDARRVLKIASGFDADDPFSRSNDDLPKRREIGRAFTFGVPAREQLRFFGNVHVPPLFDLAVERLKQLGGTPVVIDYTPLARAAALLYEGPWVAERLAAIGPFIKSHSDAMLEVTRSIIGKGVSATAVDAFEGTYVLNAIRQVVRGMWETIDLLLLPTAGTIYTKAEIASDPIRLNTNLGYYTNFVNLLDQCALALPAGIGGDGLPAGITLLAPAGADLHLLRIGAAYHQALGGKLGATAHPLPPAEAMEEPFDRSIHLAVLGAHLSGQPLNHQLTSAGGRLVKTCRTAPCYRFYALANTKPAKPGLIRVNEGEAGAAIELEVWALSAEAFGKFVAAIPPPLGIGAVLLEDGSWVKGFLCEPCALVGARDISAFGGWRGYLAEGKA